VFAAAPASADKHPQGHILPAGTPYAAEVSFTIKHQIDIHIDYYYETFGVCSDGSSSTYRFSADYSFDWSVKYPQVTVPVATPEDLGKAYKKLHVKPTPTSTGTGGLAGGSYTISGSESSDPDADACDAVPFMQSGTFSSSTPPSFYQHEYKDGEYLFFLKYGEAVAAPATFATPQDIFDVRGVLDFDLNTAADLNPGMVNRKIDQTPSLADNIEAYKPLIHKPTLSFDQHSTSQGLDCGTSNIGVSAVTCSLSRSGSVRTVVHRYKDGIYRTKRDYRR
jgi:hypothetical protein